ncbi:MAG: polysaccharide deacetylase family protein [Omnitrophica WOR_2 bacterium]|jgi:peptidoglycan/xylan/chitin deacetylase (PgdA/CDA1 family)
MHFPTVPLTIQWLSPHSLIWRIKNTHTRKLSDKTGSDSNERDHHTVPKLYLTFDDGPIPEVTPQVLEILKRYNAKATFFCVGDNVRKYPQVYDLILKDGHSTGNHTYSHLKGIKTDNQQYFKDIEKCRELVHSDLLRPPYGKIGYHQVKVLEKNYKIIMWSVLTGDYDHKLTKEEVLDNAINHCKDGSIIVFHDSIKAYDRMIYALPALLEHCSLKGFRFDKISL